VVKATRKLHTFSVPLAQVHCLLKYCGFYYEENGHVRNGEYKMGIL
jgi:hypothetical protein